MFQCSDDFKREAGGLWREKKKNHKYLFRNPYTNEKMAFFGRLKYSVTYFVNFFLHFYHILILPYTFTLGILSVFCQASPANRYSFSLSLLNVRFKKNSLIFRRGGWWESWNKKHIQAWHSACIRGELWMKNDKGIVEAHQKWITTWWNEGRLSRKMLKKKLITNSYKKSCHCV